MAIIFISFHPKQLSNVRLGLGLHRPVPVIVSSMLKCDADTHGGSDLRRLIITVAVLLGLRTPHLRARREASASG